jgi:hypothetical protein
LVFDEHEIRTAYTDPQAKERLAVVGVANGAHGKPALWLSKADANFIAAAPERISALEAELETLRQQLATARKDEAEACAKMLVDHVELYRNMGSRFQDHEFPLLNAAGSLRLGEHAKFRSEKPK